MPNTRFEGNLHTFDSMDYHFEQIDYIPLDRINLKTVAVPIPGGEPKFYRPQLDTPSLKVKFAYVGHRYSVDIDQFASKLYNERKPTRMILAEHRDRYYPVLIVGLPTEAQMETLGFVELEAQMIRSFAFRRWKDSEITTKNPDIDFSMPIVPSPHEYTLDGSRKDILYFNEGVGIKPILEFTNVNHVDIYVGNQYASFQKPAQKNLILDFENMTATDGVQDRSRHLYGDVIELPNGEVPITLLYYPRDVYEVLKKSEDELAEDFLQGSDAINVEVPDPSLDGPASQGIVQLLNKGDASFTRASTGYGSDGTPVASHQARFAEGRFGDALLIEEGTTQLLTNAGLSDLSDWDSSGIEVTSKTQGAGTVVRASAGEEGTQRVFLSQAFHVTAGNPYTAQVQMREVGSGNDYVEMRLDWLDSSGSVLSDERRILVDAEQEINELDEVFHVHALTGAAPVGAVRGVFYAVSDGGTQQTALEVEATQPMVSEGTRIPTWHLSGTRAVERLSIPNVLNEEEGELSLWAEEDGSTGTRYLLDSDGTSRFSLYQKGDLCHLILNGAEVAAVPVPFVGWHRFTVTWKGANIKLFVDDKATDVTLESAVSFADVTQLFIGCHHESGGQFNGLLDDFRISDVVRVASLDEPSDVDLNTVYKLSFDGNLYAATAGQYTSRLHEISVPSRRIAHVKLSWREIEPEGSISQWIQMEAQAVVDGIAQGWKPIGNGGKVSGIDPGKVYADLQVQYRATLIGDMNETRSIKLDAVKIEVMDKKAGKMKIHSRKRFV